MINLALKLTLLSDAEPGTGLGTETVDGLVPRDVHGRAYLPATHLKGLLRDRIQALSGARNWPPAIEAVLLGEPGVDGDDGLPSSLHMADALPVRGRRPIIITITRTAIGQLGSVIQGSLRTVEAIAAGESFTALARVDAAPGSTLDIAARLGLMTLEYIGGGRTRGGGLCRIEIAGETRTPGMLLHEMEKLIASGAVRSPPTRPQTSAQPRKLAEGPARWFRLVFRADSAICCPEIPVNGATNHIRSAPVIPASAVQGALITKLAGIDPALADACLVDSRFRAWPFVPVLPADVPDAEPVPFGVRVDLAHRMSKLPDQAGHHDVRDTAIAPYHWSEVAGGSPLKSFDGILRRDKAGKVTLWKASELPRLITGHGVHHAPEAEGGRTLFSVEALAPLIFSGLVALPVEAADALEKALVVDPLVALGKARSVRGTGRLEARRAADLSELFPANVPAALPGQVFVVQSPLALPDDYQVGRAESALQYLAQKAGWGQVLVDSEDEQGRTIARTAATCGVRFGWNRHGVGEKADSRHRRLRARRVILPGSVLVLKQPLTDLPAKLLAGLGEGRECGFGALLPHPGVASPTPYRPVPTPMMRKSCDQAGHLALELFLKAGQAGGPSPSQIAAVARRIGTHADQYLDQQITRGAVKHWHRWEPVFDDVKKLVMGEPELAKNTLRAWQNLAIIHRENT